MFNKKRLITAAVLVVATITIVIVVGTLAAIFFLSRSGDTEMVFAATEVGKPEGDRVTKNIGPAGGTLSSPDGRLTLTVPQGALTETIPFSMQPITNKADGGLGLAYRLGPDGMTFTTPLQLSVRYDDHDLEGTVPEALTLAYQDGTGAWHGQKIVKLDLADKTFTISTTHFTDEAVVPGIRMSPAKATVYVGEYLFISLVMIQCKTPGFWYKLWSRPLDCSPSNIQVNRDWKLDGPGKIGFATKAPPPTFSNPINGQLYTAPAKKPTQNVAIVEVTTNAQGWNPATGEVFAGPRTFKTRITIIDRGYKATGTVGTTTFSGNICDLEAPFTVGTDNQFLAPFEFTPNNSAGGSWKFATKGGFVIGGGGGEYTLEGTDTLKTGIAIKGSSSGYGQGYGRRTGTVGGDGNIHLTLTPLTGNECGN